MTLTLVVIAVVALALTAFVLLPLALPSAADPLPDARDPLLTDLEEERAALLAAIRELDARTDLSDARRAELHARYEAKAAKVLKALDERRAELDGAPAPAPTAARGRPRVAWGWVSLLVVSSGIAATLGGWVLPRVGQDATVTTADAARLEAGQALRDAERAAEDDPSGATFAALGDVYWQIQDPDGAREAYARAVEGFDDAPARAFLRLGLLRAQEDPAEARVLLEQARLRAPDDPTTLGSLGELYLQQGAYLQALEAFEALDALPGIESDELVVERLELLRRLEPLARAVEDDPTAADLRAFGNALWDEEARNAAVQQYFRILTEFDPNDPLALARVGEALFLRGSSADAVQILQRARSAAADRDVALPSNALLFLGNAAFAEADYATAIDAWEALLASDAPPGRVPQLLARAEALAAGEPDPGMGAVADAPAATADGGAAGGDEAAMQISDGPGLYAAHCAQCHGARGQGGSGPRLTGNPSVARVANVENLIRYGRGLMPGYQATLSEAQILTLRDWTVDTFAP